HFKRLFTELFGGGEAALHLIESDDPLEAGLEIIAKPPGKKPQTLSLLSGGEQAVTALALIFAVFLTNPSPICVLDAVDAPRNDAAERAAAISKTYRDGGNSAAIRSESDALAYALARLPATYAADIASLNALCEIRLDFAPTSLLDIGAGPGTATWAAAQAFPSLREFKLLDANEALYMLGLGLAAEEARFRDVRYERGHASAALAKAEPADLVIASYVIGELGDTERPALASAMWQKTRDTPLVIEPGTPAGYARIIALRKQLI